MHVTFKELLRKPSYGIFKEFRMEAFFLLGMETDRNTLKFQKEGTSVTKDLYTDFGFKTTSVPLFVPMETKEPSKRDWSDEDGEDVYLENGLKIAAYDAEVDVIYKGSSGTFKAKQQSLYEYLRSGELSIYSPYSNTGCKGAYFKGFSDFDFTSDSIGDVGQCTLNFRVTKPAEDFSV